MSALYGLAAMVIYVVAMAGVVLARDKGLVERFDPVAAGPEDADPSALGRLLDGVGRRGAPLIHRLQLQTEARRLRVRRRLDAGGRPFGLDVEGYARRKAAWGTIGTVGAACLLLIGAWYSAIPLLILSWMFVDLQVDGVARRRQGRIDRDLPDFLDVLAVCVNAGIAFRPAMARVSSGLGGPVSEEIDTTLRQIALGAPRREAFESLRERNTSEFIGSFVTAFLQAEELGVPLADALNDLARDMRQAAYQRARQRAQRAAPRVSLVVTLLIMPGAVLLVLGSMLLGTNIDFGAITGQ